MFDMSVKVAFTVYQKLSR